ncbi:MAG: cytochrome bc complex cytochrome b subunit [Acidobacteriota bacterium]
MSNNPSPSPTVSSAALWQWIQDRIPLDLETLRYFTSEPVPYHLKRWWWCLGGTPAYLFMVQVVTGILLTIYYIPNPDVAYESVQRISTVVPYGWFIRSLHKWSSNLMIVTVILHMMRVFFTGAYRKPRELNWMIGIGLVAVILFFGFTGYSLIYEQLSYWGITVAANLTDAVPLIGDQLSRLFRGGERIGDNTLTRLFILHIGILPTAITLLLFAHILLVRLHGVTEFEFKEASGGHSEPRTFPFYPDHFLTELIVGVGLTILLTCLAVIFPAELAEKANPLQTPSHIKPEWYFYWTFRWLKLAGLQVAVITIGLMGLTALFWPFIDARIRRGSPKSEVSVWVGVVAVALLITLTVWEAIASQ